MDPEDPHLVAHRDYFAGLAVVRTPVGSPARKRERSVCRVTFFVSIANELAKHPEVRKLLRSHIHMHKCTAPTRVHP